MAKMESKQFVDFSSGLNYVDPELNMDPTYLTVARNVELGYDSTVKKRNGFKLIINLKPFLMTETVTINSTTYYVWKYTDSKTYQVKNGSILYYVKSLATGQTVYSDEKCTTATAYTVTAYTEGEFIQEIFYFGVYCYCYTNKGRVLSVNEDNEVFIEWDSIEAALQSTTIWSIKPTARCFGTTAADLLILSNGYDMPLQISTNNTNRINVKVETENVTFNSGSIVVTTTEDMSNFGAGTIVIHDKETYYRAYCSACSTSGNVTTFTVTTVYKSDIPEGEEGYLFIAQGTSTTKYLCNPTNGSNANVPRIYKCVMVNHYLCAITLTMTKTYSGQAVQVPNTKVVFSAKDAPGIWENDTIWKQSGGADAIDTAQLLEMTDQMVIDIGSLRGELCLFTNFAFILYKMDTYQDDGEDGQEHVPTLDTIVENAGALTAGSVNSIYDSLAFLSPNGINSVKRNVISQNFTPDSLSVKILPYITQRISTDVIDNGVTTFLDERKFVYGLQINRTLSDTAEDNSVLLMSFHPNLGNKKCFYLWDNIRYITFTNNNYGRILASDGYGIMMYANDADMIHVDTYVDKYTGEESDETFTMEMETPWLFYGKGNNVKTMEYINVVADGTAKFTFSAMFDLYDEVGPTGVSPNELTQEMVGSGRVGYGGATGSYQGHTYTPDSMNLYGSSVISSNLNLIDFSQVFMYNKFKLVSTDDKPLRLIRIGVQYKVGGIRR